MGRLTVCAKLIYAIKAPSDRTLDRLLGVDVILLCWWKLQSQCVSKGKLWSDIRKSWTSIINSEDKCRDKIGQHKQNIVLKTEHRNKKTILFLPPLVCVAQETQSKFLRGEAAGKSDLSRSEILTAQVGPWSNRSAVWHTTFRFKQLLVQTYKQLYAVGEGRTCDSWQFERCKGVLSL